MAKIATLTDNFNFADIAKWDFSGNAAVVDAQLTLPLDILYTTYLSSVSTYDLTESSIMAQLVQPPNVGDGSNECFLLTRLDSGNYYGIGWAADAIFVQVYVGGDFIVNTEFTLDAISTTDRWLRLRESGGTIFWDTSSDAITWTNRYTRAADFAVTAVLGQLGSGIASGVPGGSVTALFDNVNVAPSTSSFFVMF